MHVSDGFLPPAIWGGGLVVAAGALALSVRRFDDRRVPQIAVLTSIFFVSSWIHIPLGAVSIHLLLNGLLGIVLGLLSVPAIFVGLFLQTILLGHGGLTTLGVNTVTIASGALVARPIFSALWRGGENPRRAAAAAFVATLAAVLVSGTILFFLMSAAGKASDRVAVIYVLPNLLVAVIDGCVTASAVIFLLHAKPEMIAARGIVPPAAPPKALARDDGPREDSVRGALGIVLLWMGATLTPMPVASAHGLHLEARSVDGRVRVEAFFSDGKPARGARVAVHERRGKSNGPLLHEGLTDLEGIFSFPAAPGSVRVTVEDSSGHHAEIDVDPGSTGAASKDPGLTGLGPVWLRILAGAGVIAALAFLLQRASRRGRLRRDG
ncbi:MAG TPA: CbiM family transporter [Planctomycetota bacterium]|nr:CbiM family transporter [Planctomycetota bacterium]